MTNPNELPGDYSFKSVFEDLHAKYKDSLPKLVECAAYPEDQQNIADSWVLLEHTGENQGMGTVPWDSEQKHRFEARHKKQELPRALQVLDFLETNGIILRSRGNEPRTPPRYSRSCSDAWHRLSQ